MTNLDKDSIIKALSAVIDPESGKSIVQSGMLESLEVSGQEVNMTLALPALHMPSKTDLNFACIGAVQNLYPQAQVHLHFKARTKQSLESTNPFPNIKNIIAVASGKGGVGKSTMAVNLAIGLQQLGARVGLMDADVYGPSIPTMLGLAGKRPFIRDVNGRPLMIPLEAHGLQVMSIGNIIEADQAVVLRGPRLAAVIKQFFNDVDWQEIDYMVVDLPPGTGDVQLTLVQTVPVSGVVMVTTPQEVALADAIKGMNMFRLPQINVPILGVIENMSWFTPAELPNNRYYIFGEGGGKRLAQMSNSVLLGQVPLVQSVRESGDEGIPAILRNDDIVTPALRQVAANTLRQISLRNEMLEPTKPVGVI